MKASAFPAVRASRQSPSSELTHPLATLAACCILILSVTAHFYALGTQADPALLAYDESSTWRWVETPELAPSAANVLFAARQDFSALDQKAPKGTIQHLNNPFHSGFSLGRHPQLTTPDAAGMEAALLVLHFGPRF